MTKRDFLYTLETRLRALPKAEREETVAYYRELIDDMTEEGLSEQEAVARLEDIDLIVGRILGEKGAQSGETPSHKETPQPVPGSGRGCLRALVIAAVALVLITLILSYAGVAVVGRVFDRLDEQILSGNIELPEEEIASSIDISEEGVEIRAGDFELSVSESGGVKINGEKVDDMQIGGLTILSGDPDALTAEHLLGEIDPAQVRELDIDWVAAEVAVEAWEGDVIRIAEWSAAPLEDGHYGRLLLEGGELSVDYASAGNMKNLPLKKLTVQVPADIELRSLSVDTASGGVSVIGLNGGELDIDTASGGVAVEGEWVDCSVETASGGVVLAPGSDFTLTFESASGGLHTGDHEIVRKGNAYISGSGKNRIEVDTASGGLTLK